MSGRILGWLVQVRFRRACSPELVALMRQAIDEARPDEVWYWRFRGERRVRATRGYVQEVDAVYTPHEDAQFAAHLLRVFRSVFAEAPPFTVTVSPLRGGGHSPN